MADFQNPHFIFHSETDAPGGVMQLIDHNQDIFLNFGPNVRNNHELARQRGSLYGLPYATALPEILRAGLLPPLSNLYGNFPGRPQTINQLADLMRSSSRIESSLIERQIKLAKETASIEHQGVLLTHGHEDAFGGVHFLKPSIPIVASQETLQTIRLKEDLSTQHKDEFFEVKRRDLPKVGRSYQTEERTVLTAGYKEEFALGEFSRNVLHKVDHMLGASAAEIIMPNNGPRVVFTLDMGVGSNTEHFIESTWGSGDVDLLVLDSTAIGGERQYNEPRTSFRIALEEKVYAYPQSNAFVEIPQRHIQRLVNLIEVAQKTKRKVYVPIDMAYYAKTLLPQSMQNSFKIYLPQRESRTYSPSDYPAILGEIAFSENGDRNPDVLTIEELVSEVQGEKGFVVMDNHNHLMQMVNSGDVSHRKVRNSSTSKVDQFQNIFISAGYNYRTQLTAKADMDAADNAGLVYKEILLTDHTPEPIMQEYLLAMTSGIILTVHTSNPEGARRFVKRIQPNAVIPTISRSGIYEIIGGQKGIKRIEI